MVVSIRWPSLPGFNPAGEAGDQADQAGDQAGDQADQDEKAG